MAIVKPFKGLRPKSENASLVTCPPYDVLNTEEAKQLAKDNPISLLHVTKPEIDLEPTINQYDDRVYEKAKENMDQFEKDGILIQDEKPIFYLYKQIMPIGDKLHAQTGLVACASVDEYERNIIKKHELTRKDKEDDRTRHIYATMANTGPVFLVYKDRNELKKIFNEIESRPSEYDFTGNDGIRHILWLIDNPEEINNIEKEFKAIDVMYVADGHHRSASAMRVKNMMKDKNPEHKGDEEYNFFLSVIFPASEMNIMAYNRVVKNLNGHTKEEFFKLIEQKFEIKECSEEVPMPEKKHDFGMYIDKKGYIITAKAGSYDEKDPVESLDASILQNNLLDPILGIKKPREDKNIDFVGGIRGNGELKKLTDSGKFVVAFALYPTSIKDLIDVADAGKIMPPKSTWFEPKLRDGMAIHLVK